MVEVTKISITKEQHKQEPVIQILAMFLFNQTLMVKVARTPMKNKQQVPDQELSVLEEPLLTK